MTFPSIYGINIYIGGNKLKKTILRLLTLIFLIMFCFSLCGCKNNAYKSFSKTIKYEDLDNVDKKMLSQLNKILYKSKENLWQNFNLKNKPLIMIRKDENDDKGKQNRKDISYYAINIDGIEKEATKKVKMPEGFYFKSVYRFNKVPDYLSRLNENHSLADDKLKIGNIDNIFYFKYNSKNFTTETENNIENLFPVSFSKSAFEYYVQNSWKLTYPKSIALTKKEISYIGLKYKIIEQLQKENKKEEINKKKINMLISEYISVEAERYSLNNKEYLEQERIKETVLGSSLYISFRASKLTNTKYDILQYENKSVTLSEVFNLMSQDKYPVTFISNDELSITGMILCISLNNIQGTKWQSEINKNDEEKTITLYDIIHDYYKKNKLKKINIEDIKEKYNYNKILEKSEKIQRLL